MAAGNREFVSWDEYVVFQENALRIVHYYLKDSLGESMLAIVGTEKSKRHITYVVSEDYLNAFGYTRMINSETKWRSKREVVDWLTCLISKHHRSSPISRKKLHYVATIVSGKKPPSRGFLRRELLETVKVISGSMFILGLVFPSSVFQAQAEFYI